MPLPPLRTPITYDQKSDANFAAKHVFEMEGHLVECADCHSRQAETDLWWCRSCARALCNACNLLNKHTEHDSRPWDSRDILVELAESLESRCSFRSKHTAAEEIHVRQFVSQLERVLLDHLCSRLESANEHDRIIISRINNVLTGLSNCNDDDERQSLRRDGRLYNYPLEKGAVTGKHENVEALLRQAAPLLPPSVRMPSSDPSSNEPSFQGLTDAQSVQKFANIILGFCLRDHAASLCKSTSNVRLETPLRNFLTSTTLNESREERDGGYPLEPKVEVNHLTRVHQGQSPAQSPNIQQHQPDSNLTRERTAKDADSEQTGQSALLNVLSFHFGSQFLTRPIDVTALSNQRLAVSDSCGGVYIVTWTGDQLAKLSVEGGSASSLCIDPVRHTLLVSVMHKGSRRAIHVFDMDRHFQLVQILKCPEKPEIEASRTRWLAVDGRGELFLVSGDNTRSALCKYYSTDNTWSVVKECGESRWQFLSVAEDQPQHDSVVLMTCDAAQNRLLLLAVNRRGVLLGQYDLTQTYHLADYVRCPASALVDQKGNVLILDYANGKLWLLASGSSEGTRRIRVLTEVGGQQALGMAADGGWAFLASFSKKRIYAIRYLEDINS